MISHRLNFSNVPLFVYLLITGCVTMSLSLGLQRSTKKKKKNIFVPIVWLIKEGREQMWSQGLFNFSRTFPSATTSFFNLVLPTSLWPFNVTSINECFLSIVCSAAFGEEQHFVMATQTTGWEKNNVIILGTYYACSKAILVIQSHNGDLWEMNGAYCHKWSLFFDKVVKNYFN